MKKYIIQENEDIGFWFDIYEHEDLDFCRRYMLIWQEKNHKKCRIVEVQYV